MKKNEVQLNEYQQSLFDSKPPKRVIKKIVIVTINLLLITGLYFSLQNQLPDSLVHWLTFGLILTTVYTILGLLAVIIVSCVIFGFKVAIEVDENTERLEAVHRGIKKIASVGICQTIKLSPYRVFDAIADFIIFFLMISNNYLTLGTIFFVAVLMQWSIARITVGSIKVLLSKIPDPLEADGKKPDIDTLMDDLISGGES